MNRKILITIAISIIFVSAVGFIAFSQFYQKEKTPLNGSNQQESKPFDALNSASESDNGGKKIQENPTDGTKLEAVEVDAVAEKGLTICADKCGDGACQSEKTECAGLNCICQENPQECPQDCR